jgi:hypothetical protein
MSARPLAYASTEAAKALRLLVKQEIKEMSNYTEQLRDKAGMASGHAPPTTQGIIAERRSLPQHHALRLAGRRPADPFCPSGRAPSGH